MFGSPKVRSLIRATLARLLFVVGALHLLSSVRLRNRAVVLMYHRVVDPEDLEKVYSHPGIVVETPTFEKHLRFLRAHFHLASLQEFRDHMISGQPFAKRTCLVTFDDGWEDNYTRAFPLLVKYNVPATIFLTSGFVGTGRRFWQESLAYSLFRSLDQADGATARMRREILAKLGLDESTLSSDATGKAKIKENVWKAKNFPAQERNQILDDASSMAGVQSNPTEHRDSFLTWAQVKEMATAGIDFGSHTVNHQLLATIRPDDVRDELVASKRTIEKALADQIVSFAYPSGNHNAECGRIVADCGYQLAFSAEAGRVGAADDRFAIKRINIHQGAASSTPLLMAKIVGIL